MKKNLVLQISQFEAQLQQKYSDIRQRLETKEGEIDKIKKLFVDKLRELESNFAEIGDHIIANQAVESQKKDDSKQEKAKQSNLMKFINTENDQANDQHEKELDDLNKANSELHE